MCDCDVFSPHLSEWSTALLYVCDCDGLPSGWPTALLYVCGVMASVSIPYQAGQLHCCMCVVVTASVFILQAGQVHCCVYVVVMASVSIL